MARLSFNKVAEFQKRGAIHFHAVIRIDAPDGPDTLPPRWATTELLTRCIEAAAAHPYVTGKVPAAEDQPARTLCWGKKLDVRPITAFDSNDITEQKAAAYVAQYATKAAETTGTLDRRIGELDQHRAPDHARRLIRACWHLDLARTGSDLLLDLLPGVAGSPGARAPAGRGCLATRAAPVRPPALGAVDVAQLGSRPD